MGPQQINLIVQASHCQHAAFRAHTRSCVGNKRFERTASSRTNPVTNIQAAGRVICNCYIRQVLYCCTVRSVANFEAIAASDLLSFTPSGCYEVKRYLVINTKCMFLKLAVRCAVNTDIYTINIILKYRYK